MKKIFLSIMLSVGLLVSACQKAPEVGAQESFESFMEAFKQGDMMTMIQYVTIDESTWSFPISIETIETWIEDDDLTWLKDYLYNILEKTRCTVLESTQGDDEAVLKVKVETYDYGAFVDDIYAKSVTSYLLQPHQDLEKMILSLVEERLPTYDEPYEKIIDVHLVKKEDWKIDFEENETFFNALSGGSYFSLKDLYLTFMV